MGLLIFIYSFSSCAGNFQTLGNIARAIAIDNWQIQNSTLNFIIRKDWL